MKRCAFSNFSRTHPGVVAMLFSALGFSLMAVFVKLSGDLPTAQKAFFRNFIAAGVAFAAMKRSNHRFFVPKSNWPALIIRAIFGTLGLLCNYYVMDHMLLSDASILGKTSPFFTLFFCAFLLKEKIRPYHWGALIAVFFGCSLVIKPQFGSSLGVAAIGLCAGFFAGGAYALVRWLKVHGQNSSDIIFFFSAFSCVSVLPLIALDHAPMTLLQIVLLLCAGLCASLGQFGMTAAFASAPASDLVVYEYAQVLFAALWGFLFFGQMPDFLSWCGYLIVIGAAVFMNALQKRDAQLK